MKYIDADRLREELQKPKTELKVGNYYLDNSEQAVGYENALIDFELLIDSLQHEQSAPSNGKFVFPSFLYARTVDNKTIDVAYAPQSMDAVEYIRNELTVQAEMDLEEEIDKVWNNGLSDELAGPHNNFDICARLARHFYELGLNARKEE